SGPGRAQLRVQERRVEAERHRFVDARAGGAAHALGHAARQQGRLRTLLHAAARQRPAADQGELHAERAYCAARERRRLHRALHLRVPDRGPQAGRAARAARQGHQRHAGREVHVESLCHAVTGGTLMKAVRIHAPGGPEALKYEDVPEPSPGQGQATIKVGACGVNYIDVYFRTGQYKAQLPLTIGLEGAGTVTAVGPGVTDVKVGDRVAWTGIPASYAQVIAAPADRLVKLPDGLSFKDGAAAMLQGMTAHYLAISTYPLKKGDVCVVHAAAGGVGLLLCQIAKMRGATVIGTVSTEEKAKLAKDAGADHTILFTKKDLQPEGE